MNEPKRVFLCGYSGRQPDWLLAAATSLDCVIWDIRYSARSRRAEWSAKNLAALLGDRYEHRPEFGNANYKGGPILLADPAGGVALFDAESRDIILLCQCATSQTCHRRLVGDLLMGERGVTVREIDSALREIDSPQESQMELFQGEPA